MNFRDERIQRKVELLDVVDAEIGIRQRTGRHVPASLLVERDALSAALRALRELRLPEEDAI